jgi:hypothetical protein
MSKPFQLLVVDSVLTPKSHGDTEFRASPSPFATAKSPTCSLGLRASRWRLPPVSLSASAQQKRRYIAREHAWWLYNNPGFGFSGKTFAPGSKGGNGEGFGLGFGSAGSFYWIAVMTVKAARA